MPDRLKIRNLTAHDLKLGLVEHFEQRHDRKRGICDKFEHLTAKIKTPLKHTGSEKEKVSTSTAKTSESSRPFKKQDVDLLLKAFEATQTAVNIRPTADLRLSFQDHGGKTWRIEISATKSDATSVTCVGDYAEAPYTAIYRPPSSLLTFFDNSNPNTWMQAFPDSTSLSALSIPGTHNSPTCYPALPSVRCQAVSITEQLENGIRFLDVRVQVDARRRGGLSNALSLVHSAFPISFSGPKLFAALVDDVYGFLEKNPSETVIMSLKREGRGDWEGALLAERLMAHYTNPKYWHVEPGIPNLGEVRGKIVVLRRFGLSKGSQHLGIDATNWADNTADYQHGDIRIQDFYNVSSDEKVRTKIGFVNAQFERAAAAIHATDANPSNGAGNKQQPLFINFLTANNFFRPSCWPDKIAAKLNPAALSFLCERNGSRRGESQASNGDGQGDGGLGIVVCDWVGAHGDWDLVKAIIGTNSRLLMKLEQKKRICTDTYT